MSGELSSIQPNSETKLYPSLPCSLLTNEPLSTLLLLGQTDRQTLVGVEKKRDSRGVGDRWRETATDRPRGRSGRVSIPDLEHETPQHALQLSVILCFALIRAKESRMADIKQYFHIKLLHDFETLF